MSRDDTAAAIRALRIDPEHVGMGVVSRHLDRQFAAAHRALPIPAWAMLGAANPLEQTIDAESSVR